MAQNPPTNGQDRPQRLLSKAAFAKTLGLSSSGVGKALREGALRKASVSGRVDANHPDAVAYAEKHRKKAERRKADLKSENGPSTTSSTDPAQTSNGDGALRELISDAGLDISRYADMTLRELVENFGSVRALKDWLEALKKIEDIREKRLNNEEVQKQLISRELVKTHVFGFLEAGNRRLLGDTPKTIARRLFGLARSDAPIEEAEKLVREIIGSQLDPQKKRVAKLLREAG